MELITPAFGRNRFRSARPGKIIPVHRTDYFPRFGLLPAGLAGAGLALAFFAFRSRTGGFTGPVFSVAMVSSLFFVAAVRFLALHLELIGAKDKAKAIIAFWFGALDM